MAGKKKFVNNTKSTLDILIYVRKGADPSNGNAGQEKFRITPGNSHIQQYGDAQNIYLNGISFSWEDKGARLTKTEMVEKRGCWWDDVMNTNSVITWSGVGKAAIKGSN